MGLFSYACSPRVDPMFSNHLTAAFNGEAESILYIQEYIAHNYSYPLVKYLTDTGAINWLTDDESIKRLIAKPSQISDKNSGLKMSQNEKVHNYLTKILKRRG